MKVGDFPLGKTNESTSVTAAVPSIGQHLCKKQDFRSRAGHIIRHLVASRRNYGGLFPRLQMRRYAKL